MESGKQAEAAKGNSPEFKIRLAYPEDAKKMIALLVKQYGDKYVNQKLYQEEFIYHVMKNKTMYFAVVELDGGALAGMVSADTQSLFPGCLLFMTLTIDPQMRRLGLGKQLCQYFLQTVGLEYSGACVYGYCLTFDNLNQSIQEKLGFGMTGFVLNRYFYDRQAENLAGLPLPLKRSHLVVCFPLGKKETGTLYAPLRHAEYIKDVYASLGVSCSLSPEGETDEALPACSDCTTIPHENHRYCELLIRRAGLDLKNIVTETLERYGASEQQTFNAFINLNDPGGLYAYRLLEERGFFFTGIQPLAGPGEYMILYYSPTVPVLFEEIKVIPLFEERFEYIQNEYRRRIAKGDAPC